MICEKCGKEFDEGRNCPHCGALAIFVNDDEYEERKQEWEVENAPEEVDEPKKKFRLKIHVDPAIVKKVVTLMAVVVIIATAILWLVIGAVRFFTQEKYILVYDRGNFINSDSKKFVVYSEENAIYSADGNYIYVNTFVHDGVVGTIVEEYADITGGYAALVSVEGTDNENAIYHLYCLTKNEAPKEIKQDSNLMRIVEINDKGQIIFESSEIGTYEATLSTAIYRYDGAKCTVVVEDIADFLECEAQDQFIYYDMELQAYLYHDGEIDVLSEGHYGSSYVVTSNLMQYYIAKDGTLRKESKVTEIVDEAVTNGTLEAVVNSEKVIYEKGGALYCYGGSFKKPVMLIENYDMYSGRCHVVERHGILYFAYGNDLFRCSANGKIKKIKSDINQVYLSLK